MPPGLGLHHFLEETITTLNNPFHEEILSSDQSKPPVVQLEDIALYSIAFYLRTGTDTLSLQSLFS